MKFTTWEPTGTPYQDPSSQAHLCLKSLTLPSEQNIIIEQGLLLGTMGSMRKHSTAVTLRDLRIAKLGKRMAQPPCAALLDAYFSAFEDCEDDETQVPQKTRFALHKCLEDLEVSYPSIQKFRLNLFLLFLTLITALLNGNTRDVLNHQASSTT